MIIKIEQFTDLQDAVWFIEDEASQIFDFEDFKAEILWTNNRWRVTVQTEAE